MKIIPVTAKTDELESIIAKAVGVIEIIGMTSSITKLLIIN